jgi:hypothetical protein
VRSKTAKARLARSSTASRSEQSAPVEDSRSVNRNVTVPLGMVVNGGPFHAVERDVVRTPV